MVTAGLDVVPYWLWAEKKLTGDVMAKKPSPVGAVVLTPAVLVFAHGGGWGEPEPAWWLNQQAHPDATVELAGERRLVRGSRRGRRRTIAVVGPLAGHRQDLDAYAARRPSETAVVVLEVR